MKKRPAACFRLPAQLIPNLGRSVRSRISGFRSFPAPEEVAVFKSCPSHQHSLFRHSAHAQWWRNYYGFSAT